MTRFILAALLSVLAITPASAEAPRGFAEFAWGTSPAVIQQQFLPTRCRSTSESRHLWYSVECRGYLVEGLTIPLLRLDFEPADSLAGYYMLVARGSYRPFKDLFLQRFGRPTSRRWLPGFGDEMHWTWAGISATMIERCGAETSCVEVRTTAIERRREETRERERRDAVQAKPRRSATAVTPTASSSARARRAVTRDTRPPPRVRR
jgi:hypothetical protein